MSVVPVNPQSRKRKYVTLQTHKGSKMACLNLEVGMPSHIVDPEHWSFAMNGKPKNSLQIQFALNVHTTHHLDLFWSMLRSEQLGSVSDVFRLFPNVKEQTESIGMLVAVKTYYNVTPRSLLIVVADGSTPRTGYLLASAFPMTRIYSIDPGLKSEWLLPYQYQHLIAMDHKIEEFVQTLVAEEYDDVCFICPHSHVKLANYLIPFFERNPRLRQHITLIAMPCCAPQELSEEERSILHMELKHEYRDWAIHSEKNTCLVYANVNSLPQPQSEK